MNYINFILRKLNVQCIRYNCSTSGVARRMKLIEHYKVACILDVGANTGQFASELRRFGYKGPIHSFEPIKKAYHALERNSANDKQWFIYNYALGNYSGISTINISQNSVSSSILNMLSSHSMVEPNSIYITSENIKIEKLDNVYKSIVPTKTNLFLKIDTQGYEFEVIQGALNCLSQIKMIQLELTLQPLYENQKLILDLLNFMDSQGYFLVSVDPVFTNNASGELLQLDGIFYRK